MIKYGTNKIGKIYFGSNLIGKAYFGSNLVYSSGSGLGPQPTTSVPYIRGGADGSYIDTGITADNTVKVIVWARNFNPVVGNSVLFGSQVSNNANSFVVYTISGQGTGGIGVRFSNSGTVYILDAWEYLSHYHKYELGPDGFLVDDTQLHSVPQSAFSNNHNILLFGFNNNGTHETSNGFIDIFACKIYKNNVLVRDFTAVNTPSVGLYDAVSETLFTNAGSGAFTYGVFNTDAYTPLGYIECDKQQYIDSGVFGTNNTRVVAYFRPTTTAKEYHALYGERDDGGTNMNELMIGDTTNANRWFNHRWNSTGKNVYNSSSQTNHDLVFIQDSSNATLYYNNSSLGTQAFASGSFTSSYTILIGADRYDGEPRYMYHGRIYYLSLNATHSFVPAKVNNVAGMYDTYNDVFYPSATSTPFIAGPTI